MMPRHRAAGPPRLERLMITEWRALAVVQFIIMVGACAQITAVILGYRIPPWGVILDAVLLLTYALGVLSRGRPQVGDP
jgi:hypothetical protein